MAMIRRTAHKGLALSAFVLVLAAQPACAADGLPGDRMGFGWVLPFAGLLVSIAIGQAAFAGPWARHYPKITALWSAATLAALAPRIGWGATLDATGEVLVRQYLPFVVTIMTLYVVAGGIHIRTRMSGHPSENVILLALATLAAAVMGTPGATLLFLPVLIAANSWRRHRTHTMIFLIFLAANLGGAYTPVGPPLLLGLLQGVPFLWTVEHLALPTTVALVMLLSIYWLLDACLFYPREDQAARAAHRAIHDAISVEGTGNLALLALVVVILGLSSDWIVGGTVPLGITDLPVPDLMRLLALLLITEVSLHRTPAHLRKANHFSWAPLIEVAILFAGIFVTIMPVLAMVESGRAAPLGRALLALVTDDDGKAVDWAYFALTGALSSVLDNAPTFLLFFGLAGGDAATLTGPQATTLTAISAGAAYWGAATYIANAPNFMVRSIALERGIPMPDFFRFALWSAALLLPVFGVVAWAFFQGPPWMLVGLGSPLATLLILSWRLRRLDGQV
jgi:Na+/H+ antiporter NhaD/arsenite permease-like protein